jgi:hypothetical protein
MAFSKLFNIFPDLTIHTRSSIDGTDTHDAILPCGLSVDVKTTKYPNGKLLAVPWKKANGDLFALMVGTAPSYVFKGFMFQYQLLSPQRLGNLGHGNTYIAQQSELVDLDAILRVINDFKQQSASNISNS